MCEISTTPNSSDLGGNSFSVGRECSAGEGDCDGDSQCQSGLMCSNDVGANYGFRAFVDVCEVPIVDTDGDRIGNDHPRNQCSNCKIQIKLR